MNSRLRRQRREVIEAKHGVEFDVDDPWPYFSAELLQRMDETRTRVLAEMQQRKAAEQIKEQR